MTGWQRALQFLLISTTVIVGAGLFYLLVREG